MHDETRHDAHAELPLDPDGPTLRTARPVHRRPAMIAAVAAGGLAGTPVRYVAELLAPATPGQWPVGTFGVNLLGAFLVGVLLEALARAGTDDGWRRTARLVVGTGFLGAMTTYSSLSAEVDLLLARAWPLAIAYATTSVLGGVIAAAAGIAVASAAANRARGQR